MNKPHIIIYRSNINKRHYKHITCQPEPINNNIIFILLQVASDFS